MHLLKKSISSLRIAFTLFATATVAAPSGARLPINDGCPSAVKRTIPFLKVAQEALARGDAKRANAMLDTALRNLGNAYYFTGMADDTEMYLIPASIEERKGKLVSAATLKRSILLERLELCGANVKR